MLCTSCCTQTPRAEATSPDSHSGVFSTNPPGREGEGTGQKHRGKSGRKDGGRGRLSWTRARGKPARQEFNTTRIQALLPAGNYRGLSARSIWLTRTPRKYSRLLCSRGCARTCTLTHIIWTPIPPRHTTTKTAAATTVSCDTSQTAGPLCDRLWWLWERVWWTLQRNVLSQFKAKSRAFHSHLVPFDEFAPLM